MTNIETPNTPSRVEEIVDEVAEKVASYFHYKTLKVRAKIAINEVLTDTLTELEAEKERAVKEEKESLLGLLKIARCPDSNCDNEGTGVDGYGEPYQCQWCYERNETLTPKQTN